MGQHHERRGEVLSIFATTAEQAAWLNRCNPHYLVTCPSVVESLAEYCEEHGHTLSNLKNIRTFGEVLEPWVRELCRRIWNVSIADTYSSVEAGYIGLQCPEHEHIHVMAEDVMVEVLDDEGQACQPGETGRVVVTTLNNFAMPLLRYENGDYAEVGPPCPCGRRLPVLKRILGRTRNMFTHPNGDRVFPTLEAKEDGELNRLPVRQYQLVQRDTESVDAYLVALRELTSEEQAIALRAFHDAIGYPFRVTFHYVDEIARSPTGKYEEFRSEVTSGS